MNGNNKSHNGFLLGLIIGGGAVFLLGTKTGKQILKRISEQGFEGLAEMLEDVDLEDYEEEPAEEQEQEEVQVKAQPEEVKESPKKRFFRKVRKN